MEYPWYSILKSGTTDLSQGDLLLDCPVLLPVSGSMKKHVWINAQRKRISGVIMTQACDLEQEKVDTVIVCPFSSLSKMKDELGINWKRAGDISAEIAKGRLPRYFLLNKYDDNNVHEDYNIVDFQNVFSVTVNIAKEVAKRQKYRLRLLPPYREKLSCAYANYFSRIGLPVDIDMNKLKAECIARQQADTSAPVSLI